MNHLLLDVAQEEMDEKYDEAAQIVTETEAGLHIDAPEAAPGGIQPCGKNDRSYGTAGDCHPF